MYKVFFNSCQGVPRAELNMNVDNLQVFTVHIILQIEIHPAQKGRMRPLGVLASVGITHGD